MSIFLIGGGNVTSIKEHKGSVAVKKTCYRGLYNEAEHEEMPPRATYAEAVADMETFCKKRRDAEGGMCMHALAVRAPRRILPGTDA